MKSIHTLFLALAVTGLVAAPSGAAEKDDAVKAVHQFIDGFNKGDVKSALAACAEQTSIIDEFSPHEWHGAGACAKWAADFDVDARKNGITDGVVTLGTPRHVDVNGDRAYLVVPADYAFKMKGKDMKELGSTLTVALQKGATGWHIIGWAWTKH